MKVVSLLAVALIVVGAGCAGSSSDECDGGTCLEADACPFDGGSNGPECPAGWSDARALCDSSAACEAPGLSCSYPGAGDLNGACYATAQLTCVGTTVGAAEWRCSQ